MRYKTISTVMECKIKFVIVGAGRIGKRHATMVMENQESELVALIDIQPQENLGLEKFEVPFFNSLEDFLASNIEFDIASICTPNGLHADRKSTRLNSSHVRISYAVFCLKKKKK